MEHSLRSLSPSHVPAALLLALAFSCTGVTESLEAGGVGIDFASQNIAVQRVAGDASRLSSQSGHAMSFDAEELSEEVDAASGALNIAVRIASAGGVDVFARYRSQSEIASWNPTIPNSAGLGAFWNSNFFGRFRWDLRQRSHGPFRPQAEELFLGDRYNGGSAGFESPDGAFEEAYLPLDEHPDVEAAAPNYGNLLADWPLDSEGEYERGAAEDEPLDRSSGRLSDGSRWRVLEWTDLVLPAGCPFVEVGGECVSQTGQALPLEGSVRIPLRLPERIEMVRPDGTRMRFEHRVGRPLERGEHHYEAAFAPRVLGHETPAQFTALYLTEIVQPDGATSRFHYFGDSDCDEETRSPIPRLVETGRTVEGSFSAEQRIVFELAGGHQGVADRCDAARDTRLSAVHYPGPGSDPLERGEGWLSTQFEWCSEGAEECASERGEEGPDLSAIQTPHRRYGFRYDDVALERPSEEHKTHFVTALSIPIPIGDLTSTLTIDADFKSSWIERRTFFLPRMVGIDLPGGDRVRYEWRSHVSLVDGEWRKENHFLALGLRSGIPGAGVRVPVSGDEAELASMDPGHAVWIDGVESRTLRPSRGETQRWDIRHTFLRTSEGAVGATVVIDPPLPGSMERASTLFLTAPVVERDTENRRNPFGPARARTGVTEDVMRFSDNIWCSERTASLELRASSSAEVAEPVNGGGLCEDAFTRGTLEAHTQYGYATFMAGLSAKPDTWNRWSPSAQCVTSSAHGVCDSRQYQPVFVLQPTITIHTRPTGNTDARCCYPAYRSSDAGSETFHCSALLGASGEVGCCRNERPLGADGECLDDGFEDAGNCASVRHLSNSEVCQPLPGGEVDCSVDSVCGGNRQISEAACGALPACSEAAGSTSVSTVQVTRADAPARFALAAPGTGRNEYDRYFHAPFAQQWTTTDPVAVERSRDVHSAPRCNFTERANGSRYWKCLYGESRSFRQDRLNIDRNQADVRFARTTYLSDLGDARGDAMPSLVRSQAVYRGRSDRAPLEALTVFGYDYETSVQVDDRFRVTGGATRSAAYPSLEASELDTRRLGRITAVFTVDPEDPHNNIVGSFHRYGAHGRIAESATETSQGVSPTYLRTRFEYDARGMGPTAHYEIGEDGSEQLLSRTALDAAGFVESVTNVHGASLRLCYLGGQPHAVLEGPGGCSPEAVASAAYQVDYLAAGENENGISQPQRVVHTVRDGEHEVQSVQFFDGLGRNFATQELREGPGGARLWGMYRRYIGTSMLSDLETLMVPIDGESALELANPALSELPRTEQSFDTRGRLIQSRVYDDSGELYRTEDRRYSFGIESGQIREEVNVHSSVPGAGDQNLRSVFDFRGRQIFSQRSGRVAQHYAYDAQGRLEEISFGRGDARTSFRYGYGSFGRLTEFTSPDRGRTTRHFDHAGRLSLSTDASGQSFETLYDARGRFSQALAGTEVRSETLYDTLPEDSILETSDAHLEGRVAREWSADGVYVDYAYDAEGHVIEEATFYPGLGVKRAFFYYDRLGRTVAERYQPGEDDAISFEYEYDSRGHVERITDRDVLCDEEPLCGDLDQDGEVTTYDLVVIGAQRYEHCGRVAGDVAHFNEEGEVVRGRDGQLDEADVAAIRAFIIRENPTPLECGYATLYEASYDEAQHRIDHTFLPEAQVPQVQRVQGDWLGRLRSVGDLESDADENAFAFELRYDEAHPEASGDLGAGRGDGRITSVDWVARCRADECERDAGSILYAYDRRGRLLDALETNGGHRLSATYSNIDQLQTLTRNGDTQSYAYEGRRLESITGRLDATFEYGPLGEVTTSFQPGQRTQHDYSVEGFIAGVTEVRELAGAREIINRREFSYDSNGNLFRTRTLHLGEATDSEDWGIGAAAEVSSDTLQTTHATYELGELASWSIPGGFRIPLLSPLGVAGSYIVLRDHTGSPRVVVDAYGDVVENQRFDAFGEQLHFDTDFAPSRLASFTGLQSLAHAGETDERSFVSSLQHAQARTYDPSIGRFLQADFVPDLERDAYNYAYNDPVGNVDRTGDCPEPCPEIIVEAARITGGPTVSELLQTGTFLDTVVVTASANGSQRVSSQPTWIIGDHIVTEAEVFQLGLARPKTWGRALLTGNFGMDAAHRFNQYFRDRQSERSAGPIAITLAAPIAGLVAIEGAALVGAGTIINEIRGEVGGQILESVAGSEITMLLDATSIFRALKRISRRALRRSRRNCPRCTDGPRCFVAGTEIWTPEGYRAIEELEVGDEVYAYDHESGEIVIERIEETLVRFTDELIGVRADSSEPLLLTTAEHPFWDDARGEYIEIGEWHAGAALSSDGETLAFESVMPRYQQTPVYNVAISNQHNYFVRPAGGELALLAHNANCWDADIQRDFEALRRDGTLSDLSTKGRRNAFKNRIQDMFDDLPGAITGDGFTEVSAAFPDADAKRIVRDGTSWSNRWAGWIQLRPDPDGGGQIWGGVRAMVRYQNGGWKIRLARHSR